MPQYSGVWSLQQQMQALTSGQWATDPLFDYTTLLLQGDAGANGAQNNVFYDTSPNQFAITRNGNTTQGTFSPFSLQPGAWANYFNGSTDYLSVPDSAALEFLNGDFTIECWFYPLAVGGYALVTKDAPSGTRSWGWVTYNDSGALRTTFFIPGGAQVFGTAALNVNAWNFITITRSGNTMYMGVNGLVNSSAWTSTIPDGSTGIFIGAQNGPGSISSYANGYLSNVRLVVGQSVSTYQSNFTPSTAPITQTTGGITASNTKILTCQSNRFVDNAATPNTLTVGGTPSVQAFSPFAPQFQYTASGTGGSGYFDGTTDYLLGGTSSAYTLGTGDYCIEFWMYATNTSSSTGIVGLGGAVTGVGTVFINAAGGTANVRMNAVNGTALTTANNVWAANTWNQIVITRQSGSGRIFVNGVLQAQGSFTDNLGGTDLSVGRSYYNLNQEYFTGWLSGVRIVKGSVPTTYQTSSTTVGASIFTSPTTPLTTSSQGATAANVSILLNFTNAGILDGTMKNNLETVGNAQVSTSVVKYGSGSMYFDGSGDYLIFKTSPLYAFGTGDFTVEAWMFPTTLSSSTNAGLVGINASGGYAWLVNVLSDKITVFTTGTTTNTFTTPVQTNVWQHLAITRANGLLRCFLNGVQVGSAISLTSNLTSAVPLSVGANQDGGPSQYFTGYIDDLRITTGVARYITSFTPPSVALPRQ